MDKRSSIVKNCSSGFKPERIFAFAETKKTMAHNAQETLSWCNSSWFKIVSVVHPPTGINKCIREKRVLV
jgi:hypothetical protein